MRSARHKLPNTQHHMRTAMHYKKKGKKQRTPFALSTSHAACCCLPRAMPGAWHARHVPIPKQSKDSEHIWYRGRPDARSAHHTHHTHTHTHTHTIAICRVAPSVAWAPRSRVQPQAQGSQNQPASTRQVQGLAAETSSSACAITMKQFLRLAQLISLCACRCLLSHRCPIRVTRNSPHLPPQVPNHSQCLPGASPSASISQQRLLPACMLHRGPPHARTDSRQQPCAAPARATYSRDAVRLLDCLTIHTCFFYLLMAAGLAMLSRMHHASVQSNDDKMGPAVRGSPSDAQLLLCSTAAWYEMTTTLGPAPPPPPPHVLLQLHMRSLILQRLRVNTQLHPQPSG